MYRQTGSPTPWTSTTISDLRNSGNGNLPTNIELNGIIVSDRHTGGGNVITDVNQQTPTDEDQQDKKYINLAFEVDDEQQTEDNSSKYGKLTFGSAADFEGVHNFFYIASKAEEYISKWHISHRRKIQLFLKILLLVVYNVYLGFAMYMTWEETPSWCQGVKFLVLITAILYIIAFYKIVFKTYVLKTLLRTLTPVIKFTTDFRHSGKIVWLVIWAAVTIFLIIDTQGNRYRLVSAAGLLVLLFLGLVFSAHPRKVVWRHVQWGVIMQFLLGLFVLRWDIGKQTFQCLGNKIETFLEYTDKGSAFVFGYLVTGELKGAPVQSAIFAFRILTVIVFFSFIVSVLYYYGIMQLLVTNVGWLLQATVGTTACESMNAAANIFLSMTEAPLIIKPYLSIMTKSEIHAVLTGGFATISGSILAAYINFGVSASHLLSASVMSAPAALAFSKLFYPETEESVTTADNIKPEKAKERNAIEAGANGAMTAISLIAGIAANLIAFVSCIAFLNAMFMWFGSLVHWEFLSFEWLLSKLFIPLSLIMGVEWNDKELVARLVGLKTVVNEFVAYRQLADFQKENVMSSRSEAIATYALCGFSNFGSIGIQIGVLSAMAPERRADISSIALRAMVAGSAACFMTACVAGTLLADEK